MRCRLRYVRTSTYAELVARVLAIPSKSTRRPLVTFLTPREINALLAAPDCNRWTGRRDHALLIAGAPVGGVAAMTAFVVLLGGAPSSTTSSGTGLTLNASAVPDASYVPWLDEAGALCPAVSPPLLAAQIDQESQWDPDAVSPAGAEGMSQFMPATWPSHDEPPAVAGPDTAFVPADAIMAQGRYDCALASAVEPVAAATGDSVTSLAARRL
jgi:hypothetical protein